MSHKCELYFWVKSYIKGFAPPPPDVGMMATVVWKLGRADTVRNNPQKALVISVSDHLHTGGPVGKPLSYDVFAIKDKNMTLDQIKDMLNDTNWHWKKDALTLSLHCVTVEPTDEEISNPFCTPEP